MMIGNVPSRAGCRFIAGDPRDVLEQGEAIYCRKPIAQPGTPWCHEHHAIVFTTIEAIRAAA
jgi:hypothetical protein